MNVIVCPSKLLYNLPCPGCGITRASILLMKGDFIDAIQLNPNVILVFVCLFTYPLLITCEMVMRKDLLRPTCLYIENSLKKTPVIIIFAICEGLIWIHNYLCGI